MNSSFIFFFSLAKKRSGNERKQQQPKKKKEKEEEKKLEKYVIYHSIKKSYILCGIFIDSTPFAGYDVVDHVPYSLQFTLTFWEFLLKLVLPRCKNGKIHFKMNSVHSPSGVRCLNSSPGLYGT